MLLFRCFVLLLFVFTSTSAALAANPASEDALTQMMAARFRQSAPGADVRIIGPLQLEVRLPGRDPFEANLDRVWNVCRTGTEEDCDASASNFVGAMSESMTDQPPLVPGQLRVMVRNADYCDGISRMLSDRGNERPLFRSGPADLCHLLVADYPNSMRVLRTDDLEVLQLNEQETWALALRQTLENLPDPPTLTFEEGGYAIFTGREYTPSIILNDAGWRAVAETRGGILMAVPEDGVVILARAAEVSASQLQDAITDPAAAAERPISSAVYRWTPEGWKIAR